LPKLITAKLCFIIHKLSNLTIYVEEIDVKFWLERHCRFYALLLFTTLQTIWSTNIARCI